MNLSDYTLLQLQQLEAGIARELQRRQAVVRAELLERMKNLASAEGLTLDELRIEVAELRISRHTTVAQPVAARRPPAAKYRNPNNLSMSWSGRGRRPRWISAWLANGGTLDALANAADKYKARAPAAA